MFNHVRPRGEICIVAGVFRFEEGRSKWIFSRISRKISISLIILVDRGNFSIFILFSYIFIYFLLTKSLQFEQFRIRSQISQFEKSLLVLNVEILRNFSSFRIFESNESFSINKPHEPRRSGDAFRMKLAA